MMNWVSIDMGGVTTASGNLSKDEYLNGMNDGENGQSR